MSREDYELLKQVNEMKNRKVSPRKNEENDELIIEQNTIYEIDLDCYECLMREKKRYMSRSESNAGYK